MHIYEKRFHSYSDVNNLASKLKSDSFAKTEARMTVILRELIHPKGLFESPKSFEQKKEFIKVLEKSGYFENVNLNKRQTMQKLFLEAVQEKNIEVELFIKPFQILTYCEIEALYQNHLEDQLIQYQSEKQLTYTLFDLQMAINNKCEKIIAAIFEKQPDLFREEVVSLLLTPDLQKFVIKWLEQKVQLTNDFLFFKNLMFCAVRQKCKEVVQFIKIYTNLTNYQANCYELFLESLRYDADIANLFLDHAKNDDLANLARALAYDFQVLCKFFESNKDFFSNIFKKWIDLFPILTKLSHQMIHYIFSRIEFSHPTLKDLVSAIAESHLGEYKKNRSQDLKEILQFFKENVQEKHFLYLEESESERLDLEIHRILLEKFSTKWTDWMLINLYQFYQIQSIPKVFPLEHIYHKDRKGKFFKSLIDQKEHIVLKDYLNHLTAQEAHDIVKKYLIEACANTPKEVVEIFLDYCPDQVYYLSHDLESLLHAASLNEDPAVLQEIKDRMEISQFKIFVNMRNKSGQTPLIIALQNLKFKNAQSLIESGAFLSSFSFNDPKILEFYPIIKEKVTSHNAAEWFNFFLPCINSEIKLSPGKEELFWLVDLVSKGVPLQRLLNKKYLFLLKALLEINPFLIDSLKITEKDVGDLNLEFLLGRSEISDQELILENKQEKFMIKVNSAILKHRSEKIYEKSIEAKSVALNMNEFKFDFDSFRFLLRYIYSLDASLITEGTFRFFAIAATHFEIKALQEALSLWVKENEVQSYYAKYLKIENESAPAKKQKVG